MERLVQSPRNAWQEKVEALGFHYHTIDGAPYWDETAAYRFELAEIEVLEQATNELYDLCLKAAQHIIDHRLFSRLQIPFAAEEEILRSWEADDFSLYGRFDLAYDGVNPPKLLEFNADTPTALLEASVVQWYWLKECRPQADQFNSIHEGLIDSWRELADGGASLVHFAAALDSAEDSGNLDYLRDTALQAGLQTRAIDIRDLGWDADRRQFVDLANEPIKALFKLYPWEWLVREEFGPYLSLGSCRVIEPPWKLLLSNKGILPILWELFPGHPNLLPATFDDTLQGDRVRKPLLSREGCNITLLRNGQTMVSEGSYGSEGFIWQACAPLAEFAGNYPVIGSWIVGHQARGIGIREDRSIITSDASRFIPHFFTE